MKRIIYILLAFCFACEESNKNFYGNWSWVSTNDNKYYEVLIDSNRLIGYRHSSIAPREFKLLNDSLYIDKVNDYEFDLNYQIQVINNNKILLINDEKHTIELNRIKPNSFTIDSIKNKNDEHKFELEFGAREEVWNKKHAK